MTTYAKATDGGEVEHFEDVDTAPGDGLIAVVSGWPAPRPNAHARPFILDGVVRWDDPRDLATTRAAAQVACFADIDAIVRDAVGNRTEEYKDAENDARAFKAAGYAGAAPEMVACYARKEGQTTTWAANDIIARADAFAAAKRAMRSKRMDRQKDMDDATTLAQLDAAVAAWGTFIAQLRTQLGL